MSILLSAPLSTWPFYHRLSAFHLHVLYFSFVYLIFILQVSACLPDYLSTTTVSSFLLSILCSTWIRQYHMRNCFHTLSHTFTHFHTFSGYARSVIVTTRTRNTAKSPSSLPPVTSPSDAHSVKSLLPLRIFRTVSIAKVNLPSRFWLGMITKTRASPMWLLKISFYPVFCSRLSSFPLSVLPLLPEKLPSVLSSNPVPNSFFCNNNLSFCVFFSRIESSQW